MPVDLDLPTLDEIKAAKADGAYVSASVPYNDTSANDQWENSLGERSARGSYDDRDFITSLNDIPNNDDVFIKQAFALSAGDLNEIGDIYEGQGLRVSKYLADLPNKDGAYSFWTRSLGNRMVQAYKVQVSNLFAGYSYIQQQGVYPASTEWIYPALWLSTELTNTD